MKRTIPILILALLSGCRDRPEAPRPTQVTVGAAASLQGAVGEVVRAFERANPAVGVRVSVASSGTLQRQIEQGAPLDVFLSAAEGPMDALEAAGVIVPETRHVFASNELVLIVPASAAPTIRGFGDLASPDVRRIAIGAPGSVPAGAYALEVLRSTAIEERVLPRTVRAQHVRQVLTYVERAEVDAGIVYRTDAGASNRVRVAATAPAGSHSPIRYPLAVVRASPQPDAARAFAGFLLSPEGAAILRDHGFLVPS